jgi:hypothetical protein
VARGPALRARPGAADVDRQRPSGPNGRGAIALWLEVSTDAYYRNLVVTPEAGPVPPQ